MTLLQPGSWQLIQTTCTYVCLFLYLKEWRYGHFRKVYTVQYYWNFFLNIANRLVGLFNNNRSQLRQLHTNKKFTSNLPGIYSKILLGHNLSCFSFRVRKFRQVQCCRYIENNDFIYLSFLTFRFIESIRPVSKRNCKTVLSYHLVYYPSKLSK